MISKISLLTSFLVAVIYPLSFWISHRNPLKNGFHHFHTGLPSFLSGIICVVIFTNQFPQNIKIITLIWTIVTLLMTQYYWRKESPSVIVVSLVSLVGLFAYMQLQMMLIKSSYLSVVIMILSGLILCSALFAMNLGHWYLNVHGLPIEHLVRATYVLWFFLGIRMLFDLYFLLTQSIFYAGELISFWKFFTTLDGFLLSIALFFGTVFPFIALFFARGTLLLKNTQATTGILYVILLAILIGDLTYKYYLIKFGVIL